MSGKRIIVYSLEQARAAIEAAASAKVPVTLLSARGMATFMGPLWFKSLCDEAAAGAPAGGTLAVLDCADEPGTALAALRAGFKLVRFTGSEETRAKLDDIARKMGAAVEGADEAATLDLVDARDPLAACERFLAVD